MLIEKNGLGYHCDLKNMRVLSK